MTTGFTETTGFAETGFTETTGFTKESFTNSDDDNIISVLKEIGDTDEMPTKFYNFQCIILYAYVDYKIAIQATQAAQLNQPIDYLINTPIELYESQYMAKLFTPKTGNKQLMAFAVWVQDDIFDELDLSLEKRIKNTGKKREEIKKEVGVIRNLKQYKPDDKRKGKPYISYTIQNQYAIKQISPLQ